MPGLLESDDFHNNDDDLDDDNDFDDDYDDNDDNDDDFDNQENVTIVIIRNGQFQNSITCSPSPMHNGASNEMCI